MERLTFVFFFFIVCSVQTYYSQNNSVKNTSADQLVKIPQEEIFIHHSNSLLFAGEYLFYKVYCINASREELSEISKVGYIELVDEDQEIIFRHKIKLSKGQGGGDFFIPTSVPSGNYQLLGYTNWSLNNKENPFFSTGIYIINPYRGQTTNESLSPIDTTSFAVETRNPENPPGQQSSLSEPEPLQLITDAEIYNQRERVTLKIKTHEGTSAYGNYSISVKKKDPLEQLIRETAKSNPSSDETGNNTEKNINSVYLPELRGEILSGKIHAIDPSIENTIKDQKLSVSIPGVNFLLKIARTDANGAFLFNLGSNFTGRDVLVQLLGENEERYKITLDSKPVVDYSSLSFKKFSILPKMKESILQRSVYNQIENGYYGIKPDTIRPAKATLPFFGNRIETYYLDDYTRFATIKETFIEIIRFARIIPNATGQDEFRIRGYHSANLFNSPPLVIVDGIHLQNQHQIIQYDAAKIKSIGILRDKYFLGPEVFQGIVNIETIEGDFTPTYEASQIHKKELLPYQSEKGYFDQTYNTDEEKKSRIPDFRHQLLWEPYIILDRDSKEINFFTSDVTGEYEIVLNGFTLEGKAISLKKVITVR